jgi:hypothetical protein
VIACRGEGQRTQRTDSADTAPRRNGSSKPRNDRQLRACVRLRPATNARQLARRLRPHSVGASRPPAGTSNVPPGATARSRGEYVPAEILRLRYLGEACRTIGNLNALALSGGSEGTPPGTTFPGGSCPTGEAEGTEALRFAPPTTANISRVASGTDGLGQLQADDRIDYEPGTCGGRPGASRYGTRAHAGRSKRRISSERSADSAP